MPTSFEIVVPSLSIKAEPPVALVDENAKAKGNTKVAEAYLHFLYSPAGQKLAAKHFFRPSDPSAADPGRSRPVSAKLELVTIDDDFGGWAKAQDHPFCRWRRSSTRSTSPATEQTWRFSSRACVNQASCPVSGWRLASLLPRSA